MPPIEIHLWVKYKSLDNSIWSWWKQWESLGFKENEKDNSVYAKYKNGKFFFHILCLDDILLTGSDVNLLIETKKFLY